MVSAPSWALLPPLARAFGRVHDAAPTGRVVLFGDSDIARWRDAEDEPSLRELAGGAGVARVGVDGATMKDVAAFAPALVRDYEPAAVVVCAGENDLAGGGAPLDVLVGFRRTVGACRAADAARAAAIPVAFLSTKLEPSTAAELGGAYGEANRLVREWAESQEQVAYIDTFARFCDGEGRPDPRYFAEDGLHLSREGYRAWVDLVAVGVRALIPDPPRHQLPGSIHGLT